MFKSLRGKSDGAAALTSTSGGAGAAASSGGSNAAASNAAAASASAGAAAPPPVLWKKEDFDFTGALEAEIFTCRRVQEGGRAGREKEAGARGEAACD